MTISSDPLVRSIGFDLIRRDDDDGMTLRGHAAVFNRWTTIDSWEGKFQERILPGAFTRTLQGQPAAKVRLQFDHGQHPMIGSLPIGAIKKLSEDNRGLYVEARLSDNWLVQPVRDAIDSGAIDGMSFRFQVLAETWEKEDTDMPERSISEVRLIEVGPVVWPAYAGTDVGVRSQELAHSLRQICNTIDADPGTRLEVANLLLRDESPRDITEEPAEGISSVAVDCTDPADGHSDASHRFASRPEMTEARRRADLAHVRQAIEASTSLRR